MKLITALSTAAFVLTPAVAFAGDASSNSGASAEVNKSASQTKPTTMDQSARQQDKIGQRSRRRQNHQRKRAPISRKPSRRALQAEAKANRVFWRRPGVHLKPLRATPSQKFSREPGRGGSKCSPAEPAGHESRGCENLRTITAKRLRSAKSCQGEHFERKQGRTESSRKV
jgi:hypothetical protein